jgi:hypothetical protein
MESVIIGYLSSFFIILSIISIGSPVLLYFLNLLWSVVWRFIDDGDTKATNLVTKFLFFAFTPRSFAVLENGKWFVKNKRDEYYDADGQRWSDTSYRKINFETEAECNLYIQSRMYKYYLLDEQIYITLGLLALGLGFKFIPIITFYAIGAVGTLYSIKLIRRCYKKIKQLKDSLVLHTENKDAHKKQNK